MHSGTRHPDLISDMPLAAFAAVAAAACLWPGWSDRVAAWPLLVSLLLVGMPHGAVDFAVVRRLCGEVSLGGSLRAFREYAFAVVLAFFVFLVLPGWTLATFLLLSGIHFGLADARELDQRTGVRSSRAVWVSSAVLRGSLLIALPFASRPSASLAVFADVLHLVGRPPAAPWNAEQVGTLATLVLVAVGVGLLLLTAARLRQSQRRTAARELLETALLGGVFLLLHPLFAIGFYVLAWHSWRHMGPLLRFFGPEAAPSSRAGLVRRIAWLHVQALPLLVPTWAIFAAVAWWQIGTWDPSRLAALTVATFAVVTLPHHFLVEAMLGRIDPPAERLCLER